MAVYLELAPEFGGTRFGPFEAAEVKLGSQDDKNDIVLAPTLGVAEAHVKVLRQANDDLILAPVDRAAGVYLFPKGQSRARQVTTPTSIRSGDSFALVTPEGPKFKVELALLPEETRKEREKKRRSRFRRLSPESFKQEGRRQVWMRILTTKVGQWAQRAYTFVVSGAIFMPRNLFMIAMIGGGYVLATRSGCKSKKRGKKVVLLEREVNDCKDELNYDAGDDRGERKAFHQLAQAITDIPGLGPTLQEDVTFAKRVEDHATEILANAGDYHDLTDPEAGGTKRKYFQVRKAVSRSDLPIEASTLLPYVAVDKPTRQGFAQGRDSNQDLTCKRGAYGLTYRQARNMGLAAQLDALVVGDAGPYLEPAAIDLRMGLFQEAAERAKMLGWAPEGELDAEVSKLLNGNSCLYLNEPEDDERRKQDRITSLLARELSPDADYLPAGGDNHYALAAVAKFYVWDLRDINHEEPRRNGFSLAESNLTRSLADAGPAGDWVLDQTAQALAHAIVLPCVSLLDHGEYPEFKDSFGSPPQAFDCFVLTYKLQQNQQKKKQDEEK
jgi:hypothetical protein